MKYTILIFILFTSLNLDSQNINWEMGMNIANNSYGNMHPRMAIDRAGNPLIIWGKMSDESVYFSRWNSTSFTTPIKLNPTGFTVANASWMGPDIASLGDTVYVVFKRSPENKSENNIFIISSFDGGKNFSAPIRVDFIQDSLSRFPTVTIDSKGNPIVAFMKFNSKFLESRWVVTKSTDMGKTFAVDTKASGYSGADAEVCDCCPGAIVATEKNTVLLYRDNYKNIRDIWAAISDNACQSFDTGFHADNTNWMITSCPSTGPDGIIIGDTLYSVYMSGGSKVFRNYLSKSTLSNSMVATVTNLGNNIMGLSQQNYPRIATDGKAAAIVWRQNVDGVSQLPILFTPNITSGFSSNYEIVDIGDNSNCDVEMANGKIYVAWQDDNSGTIKYRKGSYNISNISSELSEQSILITPNPTSDFVNIQCELNSEIRLINLIGETLQTVKSSQEIIKLDLLNLDKGIYILEIRNQEKIFTQKLIKQ